jgi:alpha,alpha-trehalose phosphorylase
MRDHNGVLSFAPRLPRQITQLDFALLWRGLRLWVKVESEQATYQVRDGESPSGAHIELLHYGEEITVQVGEEVTRPIPEPPEPGPTPHQPAGRAPRRRGAEGSAEGRE